MGKPSSRMKKQASQEASPSSHGASSQAHAHQAIAQAQVGKLAGGGSSLSLAASGDGGVATTALRTRAAQRAAMGDVVGAISDLKLAVNLAPQDAETMEELGALLAETGQSQLAEAAFRHAIAIAPEVGHEKYMALGQLLVSEGNVEHGAASLRKGVDILRALAQSSKTGKAADVSAELSVALCSLAEAVLHAHAFEDDAPDAQAMQRADGEVQALLEEAAATDTSNPEPWQALASLRLTQGDSAAARTCIAECMKRRSPPASISEEDVYNSFESHFACAKLLVEVGELADATALLERLVEVDDGEADVWYVLGVCHLRQSDGAGDEEATEESLACAAECVERGEQLCSASDSAMMDDDMDEDAAPVKAGAGAGIPMPSPSAREESQRRRTAFAELRAEIERREKQKCQ